MESNPQTFIIMLGPPASGKGTQAYLIASHIHIPHISSGELFRENIRNRTPLGLKAKVFIDRGNLVPDDLTIEMVMERLDRPDTRSGAILDGFPRTIAQAEALDAALLAKGQQISLVSYITAPDEVLIERISGRRMCTNCDESYHLSFKPPQEDGTCDKCGSPLYQRDDDKPETVRNRLEVYWEQTNPLIEFYRKKGILVEINGDQPIEAVQEEFREAVDRILV